jgi:hypothetical protein
VRASAFCCFYFLILRKVGEKWLSRLVHKLWTWLRTRQKTVLKIGLKLGAGGYGAMVGQRVIWTNPKLDLGFG